MFCSNCGKELRNDAKFCDGCGTKVFKEEFPKKEEDVVEDKKPQKEGKVFKCPACGEIISFDTIKCPTCGNDIRGRDSTQSISSFFDKLNSIDDEEKKIELIKTFPIPNDRESIFELMFLATSNFDAKYYVTNKKSESIASAWYTKINQCYKKGNALFKDSNDIEKINSSYKKIQEEIKLVKRNRLIMIIVGVALTIGGFALFMGIRPSSTTDTGETNPMIYVSFLFLVIMAVGIVLIVFGFKRKKTNKEIEIERQDKIRKQEMKLREKEIEKGIPSSKPSSVTANNNTTTINFNKTVIKNDTTVNKKEETSKKDEKQSEATIVEEKKEDSVISNIFGEKIIYPKGRIIETTVFTKYLLVKIML